DRNFLEQYFESEWDEQKDQTTGLELKRIVDNSSWNLNADFRLNDFFTQTEWLKLDHFWIGQPLMGDRLTWFEHSHVGYARQDAADPPTDPADAPFQLLPYEGSFEGERAATRQEIDLPLNAGPFKIVPYALGELAHWGETLDGDDEQRAYGQLGIRASLPMWSIDPTIESHLFNVHGVAHKMVFDAQLEYTDASDNLEDFPLYDEIDDDSIQAFRRRFSTNTFGPFGGPPVPQRFDERFYAVRSGLQGWVTGPTEIVDDLAALRLGLRQRWQTKRGLPGQRRIIDWITLDTEAVIFDENDNFGENLGMADYDFQWHVGDRVTLVSDGSMDFFEDGQRQFSIGAFLSQPPRGNIYFGFHSLEGPIHSNVLSTSFVYRMSPKWISSFGTSFDLSAENIGQHIGLTRVGESFLITMSAKVDTGRDDVGLTFLVEPRFLALGLGARPRGIQLPVAGQFGLE
ncbi:MAG TPA: hypothetical protein VD863_25475, partial [Bradyrhizobium sp.]|nr:hypothetical protein [Bradyrhizobium sp.]